MRKVSRFLKKRNIISELNQDIIIVYSDNSEVSLKYLLEDYAKYCHNKINLQDYCDASEIDIY